LPEDDVAAEIQARGQTILREHGYEQYEISAYARDQRRCRHNLNYWQFGDYLACGAGAHGKHTGTSPMRYARPANPEAYMQSIESETRPVLTAIAVEDQLFEFMLMALRLSDGFTTELFTKHTGRAETDLLEALSSPIDEGLIERRLDGRFRPTAHGFRFLNDLQARFLPDSPA
jgi:oxygen-independent coproporphyrinogen-3 oxidase